jgi:hypothetical protein
LRMANCTRARVGPGRRKPGHPSANCACANCAPGPQTAESRKLRAGILQTAGADRDFANCAQVQIWILQTAEKLGQKSPGLLDRGGWVTSSRGPSGCSRKIRWAS